MVQQRRLEHILDALDAGTWEWNILTNETKLDKRWLEILGYSLDDLDSTSADTFTNLCHPDDITHSRQQIADLIDNKISRYHCEQRMWHKDGYWLWVLDSGQIFEYDEQGSPLKMIGTRQDISDRKRAEADYRQESERFKALIHTSNTGAWEWDDERKELWCSNEYFNMIGRNANDFSTNPNGTYSIDDVWLDLLHPDDKELSNKGFADYLATDRKNIYESEFRLAHADGGWVWIWSRGRFILDSNGKPTNKALGTQININERKQYEQQIEQLNTSLENRVKQRTAELNETLESLQHTQDELLQNEKLASLGALVAGVAHELNTPIGNAVMVSSSLIQNQNDFKKRIEAGLTHSALNNFLNEVDESSNIIERNLERAAELIKSFKQLAVDQTSYQRRQFNLKTLIDEICITLNPSVRKTRVELITDISEEINFDSYPGPLGQVLINLINNAIAHAFSDHTNDQIVLTTESSKKDWIVLKVSDNGIGIPLNNQKKVFDPFFTTKLGQGGSGLGLHIIYTLVTGLLGGRIELQSSVGEGTTFTLQLPLNAPSSDKNTNTDI